MKLLFDHNLARRLVHLLDSVYPFSQHVADIGMADASDETIWKYAETNRMTIISKDSDFYYRSMLRGHPPKVIWIRLGNCTTSQVAELLLRRHSDLLAFDAEASASFLILS